MKESIGVTRSSKQMLSCFYTTQWFSMEVKFYIYCSLHLISLRSSGLYLVLDNLSVDTAIWEPLNFKASCKEEFSPADTAHIRETGTRVGPIYLQHQKTHIVIGRERHECADKRLQRCEGKHINGLCRSTYVIVPVFLSTGERAESLVLEQLQCIIKTLAEKEVWSILWAALSLWCCLALRCMLESFGLKAPRSIFAYKCARVNK